MAAALSPGCAAFAAGARLDKCQSHAGNPNPLFSKPAVVSHGKLPGFSRNHRGSEGLGYTSQRLLPFRYKPNPSSCRQVCSRRQVLAQSASTAPVVTTTPGQTERVLHELPSGYKMEVLIRLADLDAKVVSANAEQQLPPLVFIHGSYHAAWCWDDKWMPYLSALGFDCFAISILGQGGSNVPNAPVAGTIQSHAADVSNVIRQLVGRPPVLVGHSFGGLIVQAYLADVAKDWESSKDEGTPFAPLTGAVLACSVPPTGNMELVKRYLRTRPILSVKITLSLAAKMFGSSLSLCRDSFFSPQLPEAEVKRYQALLRDSSKIPLFDLRSLNASLPVAKPPAFCPPVMVLGAADDVVVDDQGVRETAEFFNTLPVVLPSMPHDIMLDLGWKDAADVMLQWLATHGAIPKQ